MNPSEEPLDRGRGRAAGHAPGVAALACGLLLAAPVLLLRYPPMGDLPFHESLVALLRHFGDPSWQPDGVYVLNLGMPNQLFHLAAWALSGLVATDTACKLLVAIAIAATPVSAGRLARHFGTSPWCALLTAPLGLGFAFRWGLVGNVVALPVLLLALPSLDAIATARPSRRVALAGISFMVVVYLAHESALLVAMAASVVFAVRAGRSPARCLTAAWPAAVGAGLAAYYAVRSRHLKAPSILAVPDQFGAGPLARLVDVPRVVFGPLESWIVWAIFGLYVAAFVPFVVEKVRALPGGAPADGFAHRVHRHRLLVLAGVCLLAYGFMPLALGGSTLLYQRFLPIAVALLAVVAAPPPGTEHRPFAYVVAGCASFAMLFVALPAFGDADRRFRELDVVLPFIAQNSAVAQLDLTPEPPGAVAPIPGAGARVLAERGGRLLFSFTDAPTSPVVVPAAHQWNEPVLRLVRDPLAFSPPHDMRRFRYVLVRLAPEWNQLAPVLVSVMAPEARFVHDSGEWLLFESTLDVAPPTAPDEPLAATPSQTLRSRIDARTTKKGAKPAAAAGASPE